MELALKEKREELLKLPKIISPEERKVFLQKAVQNLVSCL